jgi:glycosyltransferase involved in cell wall biosynthesis
MQEKSFQEHANPNSDTAGVHLESGKRLRIVHLATRFLTAGSEENTTLSCNWFAERGHAVSLITGDEVSQIALAQLNSCIEVIQLSHMKRVIHPLHDYQALMHLIRLMRQLKPDIIHTHQSKAGILGRLASIAAPNAVMIHGIHILPFTNVGVLKSKFYQILERSVAGLTDAFVSVSPSLRDEALNKGIGHPDKHFVVPSGMQLNRFSHQQDRQTAKAQLSSEIGVDLLNKTVVVYVASYEPRKKHLAFLDALARNKGRFENACFILAGGGVLERNIRAAIYKNGLNGLVIPLGYVKEIENVIAAADLAMFCSEREGLPRAIIQYCSSGKPIVAFHLPGIAAILVDGQNGFVCKQNDFDSFFDRIIQLASNVQLREKMAAASRSRDLSAWSVDSMCNNLVDVYRTAVRRKVDVSLRASGEQG